MAAEVIQIEIPVVVQDRTEPGLSSATKKLNSLANGAQKVSKIMLGSGSGRSAIERSIEKIDRTLGRTHSIEFSAVDNVTPVTSAIEDSVSRVGHMEGEVGIYADDQASTSIRDAEDAMAGFDGSAAEGAIDADDQATMKVHDAEDAMSAFDGMAAEGTIGVDDEATQVIASAMDAGAAFDGSTFKATLEVANDASNKIDNTLTSGISAGKSSITGAIAGAAGFAGLSLGIGSTLQSFGDFEAGMSQVAAISGASGAELDALTEKAKQMGASTKFTATESAEAFNYMAMAGWKTGDMINGIDGIMNLAAASGESLGTTSDIVTDALTAFGLSAKDSTHFADVMAQASANANTNVSMMGESFKYVAPLAGAMGYGIEDTAMALGLMANAGVKGSMAGTSLKTSIANLASPTKQMKAAMDKYGISLTDGSGKMKSLRGVMENMRESLRGLEEDEQAAAVTQIFGKEAMSGMLAIVNAAEDDWNKLADSVDNADGASKRMADTMLDNMKGSLTLLSSAFEGFQNSVGGRLAPYVKDIASGLTDAMPDLTAAAGRMMDVVDGKIEHLKMRAQTMFNSDEWQEADTIGKINIAWDTLIADPFNQWVESEGIHIISGGVGTLFSEAFKILPGGEEAGLTSWLSTGILALGASKLVELATGIKNVSDAISSLGTAGTMFGEFTSVLGPAIPIFFGVAAGVGALALAIDNYNQKQITTSLADHFGDIELSPEQLSAVAEQILDAEWKVNVDLALGELKNADKVREDAEAKLKDNQAIEYMAEVGVTLTQKDTEAYS